MYPVASPLGNGFVTHCASTDAASVRARVLSSAMVPSESGTTLTEHAAVQLAPPDARVCVGDVCVRLCVCVRACVNASKSVRAHSYVCAARMCSCSVRSSR
jgi:hypothetical protein